MGTRVQHSAACACASRLALVAVYTGVLEFGGFDFGGGPARHAALLLGVHLHFEYHPGGRENPVNAYPIVDAHCTDRIPMGQSLYD